MPENLLPQLTSRYIEAATEIASSQPSSHHDAQDPDLSPMQELLQRQAHLLLNHVQSSPVVKDAKPPPIMLKRLQDLKSIANSKFYSYRYDLVPRAWKHIFTESLVLTSFYHLIFDQGRGETGQQLTDRTVTLIIEALDTALITTGGQGKSLGPSWIEGTLDLLNLYWQDMRSMESPPENSSLLSKTDPFFSPTEPYQTLIPSPENECPRHQDWTLDIFESYMNETGRPEPVVFTDLITSWPALTSNPWNSISYLLSRTIDGKRLVPVEVGRSYVDLGWGQEIIPFKIFLSKYLLTPTLSSSSPSSSSHHNTGYLAQHNLFHQIPSLRNDIQIPDFCWADVPHHPLTPPTPSLDVPHLNAWLGPARTITPLHTDAYHNLLCQVVGRKYVRLYPPEAASALRPRGKEDGLDMSNTATVDVGVLEGWDEPPPDMDSDELRDLRRGVEGVRYWECVLNPGDTLLIPMGWWHYVRSLSVSFSVSFWWN